MSGTQPAPPYVYDPGEAWDELYDTRDGQAALPPPPRSPRQRRRRRRILAGLLGCLLLAGGGGGLAVLGVRQVTGILGLIAAGDVAGLQARVDWPLLQRGLRDGLADAAHPPGGVGLTQGADLYLSSLVDAVVAGQARPEGLAWVLRQRSMARVSGGALPEIAAVALPGGPVLRLDLLGDPAGFPSGVGLCLHLMDGGVLRVRLVGLLWPEFARQCRN